MITLSGDYETCLKAASGGVFYAELTDELFVIPALSKQDYDMYIELDGKPTLLFALTYLGEL